MAPSQQIIRLRFLLTFVVFSCLSLAADFTHKRDALSPLGVRLDYPLASRDRRDWESAHQWLFSTHLKFKGMVTTITDGQLRKMAEDGFKEMEADILQYTDRGMETRKNPTMMPGAMSIMAFGNEIFMSSSQKGSLAFINEVENSPVRELLEFCLMLWRDHVAPPGTPERQLDHKNGRRCGEVMLFHQYYQLHDQEIGKLSPKARVTTIFKKPDGTYKVIEPCGSDRTDVWGCDFLTAGTVDYLAGQGFDDYELGQLAGGLEGIDQVESCVQRAG